MKEYVLKAYFGIIHEINENDLDKEYKSSIIHGILNNANFCMFIYNKYKDDDKFYLIHFCVSKFICSEYIDYDIIEKYKPIYFNLTTYPTKEKIIKLLDNFEWLHYSLGICLLKYNDKSLIYKYLSFPEYNVINYCIKYNLKEWYDYYVLKANELGYILKYYDLNEFIYYNKPLKISVSEIPKFNFNQSVYVDDYENLSYIKHMKHRINNK